MYMSRLSFFGCLVAWYMRVSFRMLCFLGRFGFLRFPAFFFPSDFCALFVHAGNYKGLARDLFPNADRFLSILGSVASLFNAFGRVIGGLSIDR